MALKENMRMKSPWILHFDTGSCNGCDLEVWAPRWLAKLL